MPNLRLSSRWLVCTLVIAIGGVLGLTSGAKAAPYDPQSDTDIDIYLAGKSSPIAGNGLAFRSAGEQYNVDPRLIVAIAGQEQNFGKALGTGSCPAGGFNAWSWFYGGTCANSPFLSYAAGIQTVTKYMRKSYFNKGFMTIPSISVKYCTSGCNGWIPGVTAFYTAQGGNTSDLTIPRITIHHLGNSPMVDLNIVSASWGDFGSFTLGSNNSANCAFLSFLPCTVALPITKLPPNSGSSYTLTMHVLPTVNFGYDLQLNVDNLYFSRWRVAMPR